MIWIDNLKQLKASPTYFVSNELFDAYPIHKFQVRDNYLLKEIKICFVKKTAQGWSEVMIDWNSTTKQLRYVLSPRQTVMTRLYANV